MVVKIDLKCDVDPTAYLPQIFLLFKIFIKLDLLKYNGQEVQKYSDCSSHWDSMVYVVTP